MCAVNTLAAAVMLHLLSELDLAGAGHPVAMVRRMPRMPLGPAIRDLELLRGLEHAIHQSRLLKLACEGELMTTLLLCDLESSRRFAIFVGPSGGAPSGLIRRWMAVDRAGSRKHSGLRLQ